MKHSFRVQLPSGSTAVDLYWPDGTDATNTRLPLVIVAHGFARRRRNMAGWGAHLAATGLAAAVPDLPALASHARNGRFLNELRIWLCSGSQDAGRIDPTRVGLMGFSAGGLATLLAAATDPVPIVWIGLDPVDRNGAGATAAPLVRCRTFIFTAEPASCNAHGNVGAIAAALPDCQPVRVAGAVHVDAEWPTDRLAEIICGRSTAENRAQFRIHATQVLLETFGRQADPGQTNSDRINL